jgi:hypothetical protein
MYHPEVDDGLAAFGAVVLFTCVVSSGDATTTTLASFYIAMNMHFILPRVLEFAAGAVDVHLVLLFCGYLGGYQAWVAAIGLVSSVIPIPLSINLT